MLEMHVNFYYLVIECNKNDEMRVLLAKIAKNITLFLRIFAVIKMNILYTYNIYAI